MEQNILNSQTLADICNHVRDDTLDTITKIGQIFGSVFEVFDSQLEQGEYVASSKTDAINSLIDKQIVTGDGDVITLIEDEAGDLCYVVKSEGVETTHKIFQHVNDIEDEHNGDYLVISDKLQSINGSEWSFSEVNETLVNTYTQNDILNRACELIANGEFSLEAFNGRCSDIAPNLTGESKELYSTIVNCVSQGNTNGIMAIISAEYKAMDGAQVNDDSIDFERSDYYVEGFCGTVFLSVIGTAAQVAGQLIFAASRIAGLVIYGIGVVLQAAGSIAGRIVGTRATINYSSLFRLFAVPIVQNKVSKTWAEQTYPFLTDAIRDSKIAKFIAPNFVFYVWDNNDEYVYCEAFLNCSVIKTCYYDNGNLTFPKHFCDWIHEGTTYRCAINCDGYSKDNDSRFNILDNGTKVSNFGLFPDDNEVRERVGMAIYYLSLLVAVQNYTPSAMTDLLNGQTQVMQAMPNFYEPTYQDAAGSGSIAGENALVTLWWYDIRGTLPSWTDLVNKICPALRDNDVCLMAMIKYLNYTQGHNLPFSICIKTVTDKGDFWITPPNYTVEAIIGAIVTGVVVAAAAVATYMYVKVNVKKQLANGMAERYADVTNKYNEFSADPENTEKFNAYYKALKGYNFCARLTGYSSLSVINGWETGDTGSVVSSLPTSQDSNAKINQVIRLIKRS